MIEFHSINHFKMDPDNQYSPSSSYSILLNNSFSPSASINSSFSTSSNSPWDSVRVIIRVRPLDSELNELDFNNYSGKKQEDESLKITSSSSLEVLNNSNKKFFFNFNHVLDSNISQEQGKNSWFMKFDFFFFLLNISFSI